MANRHGPPSKIFAGGRTYMEWFTLLEVKSGTERARCRRWFNGERNPSAGEFLAVCKVAMEAGWVSSVWEVHEAITGQTEYEPVKLAKVHARGVARTLAEQ